MNRAYHQYSRFSSIQTSVKWLMAGQNKRNIIILIVKRLNPTLLVMTRQIREQCKNRMKINIYTQVVLQLNIMPKQKPEPSSTTFRIRTEIGIIFALGIAASLFSGDTRLFTNKKMLTEV